MRLWKYNRITGYWKAERDVTSESKDQWLAIFRKYEPKEFFHVSKNKPSFDPVKELKKNPKKRRKTKKRRTKRAVSLRIVKRRKRKIQRVRRNPVGRFVICATLENGKHFYFRKSTESFVAGLVAATRYKSVAVAMRTAKLLLKQLPREIVSIKVDQVKR
jgi:hypothetical protein